MRGIATNIEPASASAARWGRILLVAVTAAVALIVSTAAAALLAEIAALGIDRDGLRTQLLWPVQPVLAVLVVLAATSAVRLVRLMPDRALLRVRDGVWFAATCAMLVLMPCAYLLNRWADAGALAHAASLFQMLELFSQALTVMLLARSARELWYADWDRCAA